MKAPTPKKQNHYLSTLKNGVVISWIVAIILIFIFQLGGFATWKSLSGPPSGAVRIYDADPDNIWVETNDGRVFTTSLLCNQNNNCYQWQVISELSNIKPNQYIPLKRGVNCRNLESGIFPGNPLTGKINECVLASALGIPDPQWGYRTYFALFADGTISYWQHASGSMGSVLYFIPPLIISILVAVGISAVYLFKYISPKKVKAA